MTVEELIKYIHDQLAKGATKDKIVLDLLTQGWEEQKVKEAFSTIEKQQTTPPPTKPNNPPPRPSQFPGAKLLLKEAWAIFENRWKTFVFLTILPMMAMLCGSLLVLIFALLSGGFGATTLPENSPQPFVSAFQFVTLFLVVVCVILFSLWTNLAMIFVVKDRTEQIGYKEALKRGN